MKKLLLRGTAIALAISLSALSVPRARAGVVTTNGTGYTNANSTASNPIAVGVITAAGRVKQIASTVAVGSSDSATSLYNVGKIPLSAIIDPSSLVYGTGIAGLTSMSCGFGANPQPASIQIPTWSASPSLLVSAQDWHTAASFSLVSNVSTANYGKKVWQLLSLSADPGGVVDVNCTVNNGPSATGTLQFFLKYNSDQ